MKICRIPTLHASLKCHVLFERAIKWFFMHILKPKGVNLFFLMKKMIVCETFKIPKPEYCNIPRKFYLCIFFL